MNETITGYECMRCSNAQHEGRKCNTCGGTKLIKYKIGLKETNEKEHDCKLSQDNGCSVCSKVGEEK